MEDSSASPLCCCSSLVQSISQSQLFLCFFYQTRMQYITLKCNIVLDPFLPSKSRFFSRKHIPMVYGHFSSNTLQRSANINRQVVSVAGSRGLSQKGVHNMVCVASLACLRHYLY